MCILTSIYNEIHNRQHIHVPSCGYAYVYELQNSEWEITLSTQIYL